MNTNPERTPDEAFRTVREKVTSIFSDLAGNRSNQLSIPLPESIGIFWKCLLEEHSEQTAYDIAFHLSDWASDAAFLVAVHLFPERFTETEVNAGVHLFLAHAPNHVAAAAKLSGNPISDAFEVDALSGPIPYRAEDEQSA